MNPKVDRTLRKNLKRLRQLRGVTQKDMGRIAGVAQKTVSNLENPESGITPRLETIVRVASYFSIHPAMLLMEDLSDDSLTDSEVSIMLERFTQLQPEHKRRIMDLIGDYWSLEVQSKQTDS